MFIRIPKAIKPIIASEFDTVYHRWRLRHKVKEHWYVCFNILVHGHAADFIDDRGIYRF